MAHSATRIVAHPPRRMPSIMERMAMLAGAAPTPQQQLDSIEMWKREAPFSCCFVAATGSRVFTWGGQHPKYGVMGIFIDCKGWDEFTVKDVDPMTHGKKAWEEWGSKTLSLTELCAYATNEDVNRGRRLGRGVQVIGTDRFTPTALKNALDALAGPAEAAAPAEAEK